MLRKTANSISYSVTRSEKRVPAELGSTSAVEPILTERSNPVSLRWMKKTDIADTLRIENLSFEYPWTESEFKDILKLVNCAGLVAVYHGRIVGYLMFEFSAVRATILNLAVSDDFRRAGIGRQLVEGLRTRLRVLNQCITAIVRERNVAAQLFFQKIGFKAVAIYRNYYRDMIEDAYVMEHRKPMAESIVSIPRNSDEGRRNIPNTSGDPVFKELRPATIQPNENPNDSPEDSPEDSPNDSPGNSPNENSNDGLNNSLEKAPAEKPVVTPVEHTVPRTNVKPVESGSVLNDTVPLDDCSTKCLPRVYDDSDADDSIIKIYLNPKWN